MIDTSKRGKVTKRARREDVFWDESDLSDFSDGPEGNLAQRRGKFF